MSIVLVTGSCGLVGSEASAFFSEKGFDIIGIDNNSRKLFFGKDGEVYVKDVEEGISGGIENLRDFTKKADGGEVNLTIVRMPDINESGVESLFKTR